MTVNVDAFLDSVANRLAATAASLDAHIERRAWELAEPQIRAVKESAETQLAEARHEAAFQKQRDDDLIAELRRQIDAAVKSRDREFDELKRLRATVHRVRHQVRCWENEDGRWFAFRDDLFAALDGDETKEN